jgi:hypothetical protein
MYHYEFNNLLCKLNVSIYQDKQHIIDVPIFQCYEDLPEDEYVSFFDEDQTNKYISDHQGKEVSKVVLDRFGLQA